MFNITVADENGASRDHHFSNDDCLIGRGSDNQIVLNSWKISKVHARLLRKDGRLYVQDLGSRIGTWVNRERVVEYGPLSTSDEIVIGSFRLYVRDKLLQSKLQNEARFTVDISLDDARHALSQTEQSGMSDTELLTHDYLELQRKIHEQLLKTIDLRRVDVTRMSDAELHRQTELLIREVLSKLPGLPAGVDHEVLVQDVLHEAIGLGPLEKMLADDTVTEIMVNGPQEIFVEKAGRIHKASASFSSAAAVMGVIERIVAPIGRRIDESSPLVDARLKDGSRVNAVIPPLALKGPTLTIRKFPKRRLVIDDLIKFGSLNQEMVKFLEICVAHRRNIIISGGTGSGKTTLLNVLSNLIPEGERIITIEDAAELQLHHAHLVTLEARPANVEGRGQVSIRDLVKNSLRMRPDRIVVGECRGGEALDMLQAMNTGHDGSLTTAHANSPRDLISRLEVMVLMAGIELPVSAIREQVASAVDIVVQQTRFACGSRKITHIAEVAGVESGVIQLQDLFVYRKIGYGEDNRVQGYFTGTGIVPSFYDEMTQAGAALDLSIFNERNPLQ